MTERTVSWTKLLECVFGMLMALPQGTDGGARKANRAAIYREPGDSWLGDAFRFRSRSDETGNHGIAVRQARKPSCSA